MFLCPTMLRKDKTGPLYQEFVDHLLGQVFISKSFPVEVPFCQIVGWTKDTEFNSSEIGTVFVKPLKSFNCPSSTYYKRIIDEREIVLGLNEPIYDSLGRTMKFRLIRIYDPKTDLTVYSLTFYSVHYRHCPESCIPGKIFDFGKIDPFV